MQTSDWNELPSEDRKRLEELFERETLTVEEAVAKLNPKDKIEMFRLRREKFKEIKK